MKKLETAKQLGATHTINPKQENTEQRVMELTDGQGVPLIAGRSMYSCSYS